VAGMATGARRSRLPTKYSTSSNTPVDRVVRRRLLQGIGAALLHSKAASSFGASDGRGDRLPTGKSIDKKQSANVKNENVAYGRDTLPDGIRSRFIDNNNGATLHVLEAGFEYPGRPCVVLLHGWPELAYTWRNQLLPLARAGFHVVAPDQRGYGRSAGTDVTFDEDILPFSLLNHVSDTLGLVRALGHDKVAAIIGHDWGSQMAAWCALVRPDVFRSVVLMSTPFAGPPTLPLNTAAGRENPSSDVDIEKALAALSPPRKHYIYYCATRGANDNMWHAPQGVHDFLRALYHFKSADWKGNQPFELKAWAASELAKMPNYYIMDLNKGMAETVAAAMPAKAQIDACKWLTEEDLRVYSAEYARTGFQGGLQSYRILTTPKYSADLMGFSGRTIDVPSCYVAGAREWGVYQWPGALETMQSSACTRMLGVHLVAGSGHSVPEEQPDEVNRILIEFLQRAEVRRHV